MTGHFFSCQDISDIKIRIEKHSWAKNAVDHLRDRLEAKRTDLLKGGDRQRQSRNLGTIFFELALYGRLFEGWYREAAEQILIHTKDISPFTFKQTFDFCLGIDILNDLDQSSYTQVRDQILIPIAEKFMLENRRGSNIQTTADLGLLSIGILTGRNDFIERATIDPERGLQYQLVNSVYPDGFWYEQSHATYHCGSIDRILKMRWMAGRNEIVLDSDEIICKMLETLPGMAFPGGILPLIGEINGSERPTFLKTGILELAYSMFEIPWIGWALNRLERNDIWSLLVGKEIRSQETPEPRSMLYPDIGLCILKNGTPEPYWNGEGSGVSISFGPHGDWHGHAGKLGIEYRYNNHYLIRDHGHSGGYDHPIHRNWFMSTLAHSTVVIDGKNQAFNWCSDHPERDRDETGKCHAHLFRKDVGACTVSADFAYPGCHLRRSLFLTQSYLLDIMECAGFDSGEHTFDWIMHTGGTIRTDLPFEIGTIKCFSKGGTIPSPVNQPYAPGSMAPSSYDYIREVEMFQTSEDWSLDIMDSKWMADTWKITDQAMRLRMLGENQTTVYKGVCPAAAKDVYDPVILARRKSHATVFIALHAPGEEQFALECIHHEGGTVVCRVTGESIGAHFLVKQDFSQPLSIAGLHFSGKLDVQMISA